MYTIGEVNQLYDVVILPYGGDMAAQRGLNCLTDLYNTIIAIHLQHQ